MKKAKRVFLMLVLSASVLTFQSCATVFAGSKSTIHFDSEPPDATVTINGNEVGKTPCDVRVKKKFDAPNVVFKKEGYLDKSMALENNFCIGSIFNGLFLIGWVVDAASGAMMNYNPKIYKVTLDKK